MRLDRKQVRVDKNPNSKYRHYSAKDWEDNFYNSENRTKGFKKRIKTNKSKKKITKERLEYSNYLKSDYWKKVRFLVLKRDGRKCTMCESKSRLEVHHIKYDNRGNELNHLQDLTTLCSNCHKTIHK